VSIKPVALKNFSSVKNIDNHRQHWRDWRLCTLR